MASTFAGLDIALSGLTASQIQINTVSNNVANAETKGYTKQNVNVIASRPIRTYSSAGMMGTGCETVSITQNRSQYYDEKYWSSNSISGEYSSIEYNMSCLENYFNETTEDGFTEIYNDFFTAVSDLANDATNYEKRTSVINDANAMTEYLKNIYNGIQGIQKDINVEVKTQVDRINDIANEIVACNKQIDVLEASGSDANTLRDQRSLLIDELSELCSVEVDERTINAEGSNAGQISYVVKINGEVLVDTYSNYKLGCVARERQANQNDISGLYDVVWTDTNEKLNVIGNNASGSLAALMKVRDGNNAENLIGTINASKGDKTVTIENTNINEISKLNIPERGNISVGDIDYEYDGFEVTVDSSSGTDVYSYKFYLVDPIVKNYSGREATVGKAIDFEGIPYYLSKLNEFARTFSNTLNSIHNTGEDLDGNKGLDLFNYSDVITGKTLELDENLSKTGFSSNESSYYKMTCSNYCISSSILDNPYKIAAASKISNGKENSDVITQIQKIKDDTSVFSTGTPSAYFDALVSQIGVSTSTYIDLSKNQSNIVDSINTKRLETSGVDLDEEAMDLIKFQKAYELSAKVFSVMNEIYNKLMEMGV